MPLFPNGWTIKQSGPNYVGNDPMSTIKCWDKVSNSYNDISCIPIGLACHKNMGALDLADMLISLYRINIKTKHWYMKDFLAFSRYF